MGNCGCTRILVDISTDNAAFSRVYLQDLPDCPTLPRAVTSRITESFMARPTLADGRVPVPHTERRHLSPLS